MTKNIDNSCFIIMPISDVEGYASGHFLHVYEDIIKPAVESAKYKPIRADEVKETNFIHLDMLKKLIEAPIAICDLSTRNPNVLFELGIRQAFDKPVVLIQEKGTPKIFDIAPLRYLEYSKEMKYHEVIKTQKELEEAITATKTAEGEHGNINSIVRLMALSSPASIPNIEGANKETLALDIIQTQMNDMRKMLEISMMDNRHLNKKNSITAIEYERITNKLDKLINNIKLDPDTRAHEAMVLIRETEELMMNCDNQSEHKMFRFLMDRIHRSFRNL